ncbi:hypothetical protein BZA77DRAFT_326217, partial [Pyronema omphalodes]
MNSGWVGLGLTVFTAPTVLFFSFCYFLSFLSVVYFHFLFFVYFCSFVLRLDWRGLILLFVEVVYLLFFVLAPYIAVFIFALRCDGFV